MGSSDTQHIRRKSPWRWIWRSVVALLVLAGLTYGAWLMWRPEYKVTLSDAIAWSATPPGRHPAGTEFTVTLTNYRSRNLVDAEVIVEEWTDDLGSSLLIDQVPVVRTSDPYSYDVMGLAFSHKTWHGSGRGTMPPTTLTDPTRMSWQLVSPVTLPEASSSLQVKGRVVVVEGRERTTQRMPDFRFVEGNSFHIGPHHYVVVWRYDNHMVVRSADGAPVLASVKFLDANGNEIPWWGGDPPSSALTRERDLRIAGEAPAWVSGISTPPGLQEGTLEVAYWADTRRVELPFEATLPVQQKTKEETSRGHSDRGWVVSPVPDEAWGPMADTEAPFDVLPVSGYIRGGLYPELIAMLVAKAREDIPVTSFHAIVTGYRDNLGNQLLGGGDEV